MNVSKFNFANSMTKAPYYHSLLNPYLRINYFMMCNNQQNVLFLRYKQSRKISGRKNYMETLQEIIHDIIPLST